MSFAGCVSTAVVVLLGRTGKQILSYSAKAEGIRREDPLPLSMIKFHICVESEDITCEDIEKSIKIAEAISPVWIAVRNNVTVETSYEIK